jgi:5'-methylthioadenosine phosphorylase
MLFFRKIYIESISILYLMGDKIKIGIIGGSGLDNPDILKNSKDTNILTNFGKPSSVIKEGTIGDIDVAILARHGLDHSISPTGVNFRANIDALKQIGCTHIIATTACGSLRTKIDRGHFVVLDQFIDFTRHRNVTFFDEFPGGAANAKHTPMAKPFDETLRNILIDSAEELGIKTHKTGTVITIEGPRFSTIAESKVFKSWGADVINMSVAPECALANEAGIPYAAIAMSTDYDVWKEDEEPVEWEEILKVFGKNVNNVTKLLTNSIPKIIKQ